jgi:hypothetical protein
VNRRSPLSRLALAAVVVAGVAPLPAAAQADVDRPSGKRLQTGLVGSEEAPGPGDPDGSGTAMLRINSGQERICYTVTVTGIDPARAAHIHVAPAGQPGPVVVPLAPPTHGTASGCADVDRALAKDIRQNPEDYYVNVHNAEFPAGALRGQLG